MKAANYLNNITDHLHLYITFVFPTGDGIFQQDNAPCDKARIVLEWFEEHSDEFHLMSCPPNSSDLNPMEHIWDVMERQLRAQTPPCPNISTLHDRCLDIWCNLSPVPKTCGICSQASCSCFEGQRRRNALLSRWS
ncbi:hypothetical protein AVEN_64350-1 [Araneus ventricosus]|uniref:Tc1-like transposase DDE domain-containing protein n=1 Tax=Araneus ventricosus TaxID=182803 RepID=A0A4Y2DAT1_ARAVE|nr:hypothetical protein AVEN_64350-1 [Araneus ventricosus]